MDLPELLHQYGYLMIFFGTLVEGETLLMLGGYFAHSGYLHLGGVIATAFVGAVCGDQIFFHVGRNHATRLFQRFPRLHDKVLIAVHRAERHQNLVVLGMRFLWGLRIALPLAMGMTRMNGQKFFWLNLVSAAVWAALRMVDRRRPAGRRGDRAGDPVVGSAPSGRDVRLVLHATRSCPVRRRGGAG